MSKYRKPKPKPKTKIEFETFKINFSKLKFDRIFRVISKVLTYLKTNK